MSHLLISQPAPSVPLVLRGVGREATQQNAVGFGTRQSLDEAGKVAAALEKAAVDLYAAHATAALSPGAARQAPQHGPMSVGLRQPNMARVAAAAGAEAQRLTPDAQMMLVVGNLLELVGSSGLEKARARLALYQARAAAQQAQAEKLSSALEAALGQAAQAGADAEALAGEVGAMEEALKKAREDTEKLQAELDAMAPDDPARAAKQEQLAAAQQRVQTALNGLEEAAGPLLEAAKALNAALDNVAAQRGLVESHVTARGAPAPRDKRELSAAAILQKLLMMLSTIASDHALEKLMNETEGLKAVSEAREKQNLENVKKHKEETERAQDAQKKTGCAGKILKWVSAAISVITLVVGVLTFNPMMIAAGAVSTLMVVDQLAGEHLGFSVMGKLTELISQGIGSALMAFGVSEDLAKTIGSYAAMVVVLVTTIVLSMVTANAAGAIQSATLTAAATSRLAQAAEVAMQVIQVLGQVAGMASNLTQNIGQVIVAGIMVDVARLMAAIQESLFGSEIIRDLIGRIRDAVAKLDNMGLELLRQAARVMEENTATSMAVISATRGRA